MVERRMANNDSASIGDIEGRCCIQRLIGIGIGIGIGVSRRHYP
jgi:hypothetical protein